MQFKNSAIPTVLCYGRHVEISAVKRSFDSEILLFAILY